MSDLYSTVGTKTYEQLLADPQGADVISIPCTPKKGVVPRGTIMFRDTTGLYSPAATDDIVATKMLVVLNQTVDTGSGNIAEDALAYRAGKFISGAVTLAESAEVTAAHKVVLRQQGIVFDVKEGTTTFKNKVD